MYVNLACIRLDDTEKVNTKFGKHSNIVFVTP